MMGYTRQDLKQGYIHRDILTSQQYKNKSIEAVRQLQDYGTTKPYEKIYLHKDGSQIPVLEAVTQIKLHKDLSIGFVLNIHE